MIKTNMDRSFVAVTDADEAKAGATIWWRLHGECDRSRLVNELSPRSLSTWAPRPVEPETALRRAVSGLRGKRRLVRPLRRGSWAVVEEELDDIADRLKHWTGPTISLDKIGRAVLKNATAEEATFVREAYERYLDVLTTEDVSSWLIDQAQRLGAVGLRYGGGVYYLPPGRVEEWSRIVDALRAAHGQHSVYMMPTFRMTANGARAILDSLAEEVQEQVARERADVIEGSLGVRALETRATRSRELMSKIEEYEEVLGQRLDTLRTITTQLSEDVAAAKLAAEALKEDES